MTMKSDGSHNVGRRVSYPGQGNGRIISVKRVDVAGCWHWFYVVKLDSGKEIALPVDNAKLCGLTFCKVDIIPIRGVA